MWNWSQFESFEMEHFHIILAREISLNNIRKQTWTYKLPKLFTTISEPSKLSDFRSKKERRCISCTRYDKHSTEQLAASAINISRLEMCENEQRHHETKKYRKWKVIRSSRCISSPCECVDDCCNSKTSKQIYREATKLAYIKRVKAKRIFRLQLLNHSTQPSNVLKMNIIVCYWFVELHDFLTLNWNMRTCWKFSWFVVVVGFFFVSRMKSQSSWK